MGPSSDRVGRVGVHGVALLVVGELGWKFREQHESDWGIDAIIEVADEDQPTSRLIALQIKCGDARLDRLHRDGRWPLYGEKRHLMRWLEYPIPVVVVLYDPTRRTAYWQHVNDRTAAWTPAGFRIDVPESQPLDAAASATLRAVAEQWVPQRGTSRSRALHALATCTAASVPVPPTEQLWTLFARGADTNLRAAVHAFGLPLIGEAPAVHLLAGAHTPITLSMDDRGLWSVPPGTTVFVCENLGIIDVAAAVLGTDCRPLVCLGGFPSLATEYLLIGLGACGARLRVHVDHDTVGRQITDSLFVRSVPFETWRPIGQDCQGMLGEEEECLPAMLADLAGEPTTIDSSKA